MTCYGRWSWVRGNRMEGQPHVAGKAGISWSTGETLHLLCGCQESIWQKKEIDWHWRAQVKTEGMVMQTVPLTCQLGTEDTFRSECSSWKGKQLDQGCQNRKCRCLNFSNSSNYFSDGQEIIYVETEKVRERDLKDASSKEVVVLLEVDQPQSKLIEAKRNIRKP